MTITYVYENTEVRKTGKIANKTLPSGRTDLLHEVTPAEQFNGSWKKWVRDAELYQVYVAVEDNPSAE